jgi:hypothetical protein
LTGAFGFGQLRHGFSVVMGPPARIKTRPPPSHSQPQAKDVMSSLSGPTCRDLLSSSAERVRAGVQTVELEEAPGEHRNGT